jgi:hypothetical protein
LLGLAGQYADVAVLPEVKDDLRGSRLGRVITVVDRGFSSRWNLDYLRRAGGHWIAGERMRDGNPQAQAALFCQGRYRAVRDNLRVKEVTLDGESEVRWIVCHTRSKPSATPPGDKTRSPGCPLSWSGSPPLGLATLSAARPARRRPPTRSTSRLSARCATTRPLAGGCGS